LAAAQCGKAEASVVRINVVEATPQSFEAQPRRATAPGKAEPSTLCGGKPAGFSEVPLSAKTSYVKIDVGIILPSNNPFDLFGYLVQSLIDFSFADDCFLNRSPNHVLYFRIASKFWWNKDVVTDHLFKHLQSFTVGLICFTLHRLHHRTTDGHTALSRLVHLLSELSQMEQKIYSFWSINSLPR